jgi:gas vesicle protein
MAGFFDKKLNLYFLILKLKHFMKTFWTFLTGITAGAVIALLYAPNKGSETRRKVSDTARRLTEDFKETAESGVERVKSKMGEQTYR